MNLEQLSATTKQNNAHEKDIEIMHLFAVYKTLLKNHDVADV